MRIVIAFGAAANWSRGLKIYQGSPMGLQGKEISSMKAAVKACHLCGTSITGLPFVRKGEVCCCEGCLLKEKEFRAIKAERDNAYLALAEALVAALDTREHETGLHSKRVACHTLVLARRFISEQDILRQVYWGALLHDIGKIGIPDTILMKEGPLTDSEWIEMRRHPEIGYDILKPVPFLTGAAEMVMTHEERYDGAGYPRGLKGEGIPLGARFFTIIDTLDAMTSDRPYRRSLSFDTAKMEILRMSGTQFDPKAVEAFLAEEPTLREMVDLKCGELRFKSDKV